MTYENGRVSPAAFNHASSPVDQNLYFRVSCIDQRDTPVLPLSLLFYWIDGVSVEPVKL
jgi:hypothetical protein